MDKLAVAHAQEKYTRVKRFSLVRELRENRDRHEAEYEKALEGWRLETLAALQKHRTYIDKVIARIKADIAEDNPPKNLSEHKMIPNLPVRPVNHVAEYDAVIRRMEMSIDEEIHISHGDFEKFVLDKWPWKGAHLDMFHSYSRKPDSDPEDSYT